MGNVKGYRENAIALIEVQEWIHAFLSLFKERIFIPHTITINYSSIIKWWVSAIEREFEN